MKRTGNIVLLALFLLATTSPLSAAAMTEKLASNGITITVDGDEFKPRTDFSAPFNRAEGGGYIFNVRRLNDGTVSYQIQGFTIYDGEWRMYDRAYLPGGEAVEFTSTGRKVTRCGRYGGCTLNEGYLLMLTREQVDGALRSGSLRAQISGRGLGEFVITVPSEQISAALEVAGLQGGPADSPVAPTVTEPSDQEVSL